MSDEVDRTKVSFYYTTSTPHQWSSGPTEYNYDFEARGPIATLERAQELAEGARRGQWGSESFVKTTYGAKIEIETEPLSGKP